MEYTNPDVQKGEKDYSNIIVVPSNHLKWLDPNGSPLPTASKATSTIQDAEKLLMTQFDLDRRHRLGKMLYTGKGFTGRQVTVEGKHHFKGQHGSVVGWSLPKRVNKNSKDWKPDEQVAEEMLFAEGENSALNAGEVQIRLDGQPNIITAPMERVIDREYVVCN